MATSHDERALLPHPDVLAGAGLLVLCAVVFRITTTFREVPAMLSQNVPPTFFPRAVLLVIAVLSVALVIRGLTRPRPPREGIRPAVLVTAGLLTTAVALVPYLGLLETVCLVSIVLPVYWGERRLIPIAALAVGLPLAIHGLFAVALGMRFPGGVLW